MRHEKRMRFLLAAGLLTLTAGQAYAQTFENTWVGASGSTLDWDTGTNWLLLSGTQDVPSSTFDEWATIKNGGTASITTDLTGRSPNAEPLALLLGHSGDDDTGVDGHLVVGAGGALTLNPLTYTAEDLAFVGQLVIGNDRAGSLTINGGSVTAPNGFVASRLAGGSGTITISGGTLEAGANSFIGAGGGEAAVLNMTGGAINITAGELDVGGNSDGDGTINMSGGTMNIAGDLDLGGLGNARGVMHMSNNAAVTLGNGFWVGLRPTTYARLNMSGTSSINALFFTSQQGGDSVTTLQDQASITATNQGFFIATGKLRVEGHQVNINTTALGLTSVYNPTIGANGASIITASGSVDLGGTLELEFDGITPNLGDSWQLVQGQSVANGEFANITSNVDIAKGSRFATIKNGNDVHVGLEQALTFTYNTASGMSSMTDFIGGIKIKAYSLSDSQGRINTAGWNSLVAAGQADWDEVTPTANMLTELMVPGTGAVITMNAGQAHDFGAIFAAAENAMAFGDSLDSSGVKLEYVTDDGQIKEAIIDVQGTKNNLVLHVDSSTGAISLQNHSIKDISLKGYSITDANGQLDTANWNSLADQGVNGFDEANPNANGLSELVDPSEGGSLALEAGEIIELGTGVDVSSLIESLGLKFLLEGDETSIDGIVMYDGTPVSLAGDWDLDGDVDHDDARIVLLRLDQNADLNDLAAVRNNFGASAATAAAIPEPASLTLLGLAAAGLIRRRK